MDCSGGTGQRLNTDFAPIEPIKNKSGFDQCLSVLIGVKPFVLYGI
jgi:hypothetical protein